jgi:hypothetical protein
MSLEFLFSAFLHMEVIDFQHFGVIFHFRQFLLIRILTYL